MTKREKKALPDDDMQQPASSPGRDSRAITPKDVSSDDATAKDLRVRKMDSPNEDERVEEQLDDAVELSFPASDPIAIRDPDKSHQPKRQPGQER